MSTAELEARVMAALDRGDIAHAASIAQEALDAGARPTPLLLNLSAWRHEQHGDLAAAEVLLRKALSLSPCDPLIVSALAGIARRRGDWARALNLTDQALAADPSCASAWLERGFALDASGRVADAAESFARAASLDPAAAPAWGGLSNAAARLGDLPRARDAAERAFRLNPLEPLAVFGQSRADQAEGDFAAAAARLGTLLRAEPALDNRLVAFALLGDAQTRLGNIDAAYDAYRLAGETFLALHGPGPPESQTRFVRRIEAGLRAASAERWQPAAYTPVAGQSSRHIFVIGFPRSGTTLMENILASLPGAHALEERPTLEAADLAFLLPEGGIEAFAGLSESALDRYVQAYWDAVFAAGVPRDAELFIDMDPMKSLRLPLIARLFPNAHIVFMRRDPRDVVWSCFKTAFGPSSAAFEFTSLERTAVLYDTVMSLIERSRALLPLYFHEIRYENLVSDFRAETQRLCDDLGIAWTDELLRFDRTAERRGVTTASIGQVRRGLYDGSGQWRPFERQMAPVLPMLERWL